MMRSHSRSRPRTLAATVALAATAALLLAGCSSTSTASKGDAHLLVWTDATRQPLAEAYAKAHPSEHIRVVTVDGSDLESKLSLIARDTSELPDVVFTPNGQGVEFAQKYGYSANLTKLVSPTIRKGFGATLTACESKGALYCLPSDISTQMLFYNKSLFAKFGYTVPTTWDQYATLAKEVASQHPGYIVGSCGDGFCPNVYYRSSGCPGYTLHGTQDVTVNVETAADCTRVTSMLDPLIADKSVATLSPFDPDMATLGSQQKVLMLPGFVWYGSLLFQQTFKNPSGVIAAAPLPTWGDGVRGAGAAVGGQWVVSSKSGATDAAVKLVEAMTTNSSQLAQQVTFPAYQPAAQAWTSAQVKSGFYATDPTATFVSARSDVKGNLYTPAGMDVLTPFANAVAPQLKSGSTLSSQIPAWAAAIAQTATDAGYTAKIDK